MHLQNTYLAENFQAVVQDLQRYNIQQLQSITFLGYDSQSQNRCFKNLEI